MTYGNVVYILSYKALEKCYIYIYGKNVFFLHSFERECGGSHVLFLTIFMEKTYFFCRLT